MDARDTDDLYQFTRVILALQPPDEDTEAHLVSLINNLHVGKLEEKRSTVKKDYSVVFVLFSSHGVAVRFI